MRTNFHEHYEGSEAGPPSERATGMLFAAVAMIVAVLWRNSPIVPWAAFGIATIFAAVSLVAPNFLKPINMLWFQFGRLLHRIINPLVMLAVFATVFVPVGAIMRPWWDPLRSRRNTKGSTYWIERDVSGGSDGSMTNQF